MLGTQALRAMPDAVAPTPSDPRVANDNKSGGGYTPIILSQAAASPSYSAPLSMLIPASFSTSSASLSASAMFATQLLSQGAQEAGEYLKVYEELAAASQVKYKPSNATMPEPAPNNLFAKMLSETKEQFSARQAAQFQHAPQESVPQLAQVALPKTPAPRQNTESSNISSYSKQVSNAYQTTTSRNHEYLEAPVEAIPDLIG